MPQNPIPAEPKLALELDSAHVQLQFVINTLRGARRICKDDETILDLCAKIGELTAMQDSLSNLILLNRTN